VNAQDIISSGLLELYAAGLTSKEESLQVEQWLKAYPEVLAEYNEIQGHVEMYAFSQAVEPDKAVKNKIFERIDKGAITNSDTTNNAKASTTVVTMRTYWKWIAAASVILLLGSAILNWLLYNRYSNIHNTLQQTQQELADARQGAHDMKQDMDVVQSKYSELVQLNGVNATPDAIAKVFWMKNTGEVYIDPSNLPEISQGQQFQLWAIIDGKPVDAGLIITSKKGNKYRIQKMKSFGKVQAFAITVEKEGGSLTPTLNKMVVSGKI
jgi:anti-sigma-K factor RskA